MKMAAFCQLIALMMEAARTSETLVNFYQTARYYNPEDSHLCFPVSSLPLQLMKRVSSPPPPRKKNISKKLGYGSVL
jgi:hypothetical protein